MFIAKVAGQYEYLLTVWIVHLPVLCACLELLRREGSGDAGAETFGGSSQRQSAAA